MMLGGRSPDADFGSDVKMARATMESNTIKVRKRGKDFFILFTGVLLLLLSIL